MGVVNKEMQRGNLRRSRLLLRGTLMVVDGWAAMEVLMATESPFVSPHDGQVSNGHQNST
jgi:hypothetical protein